MKIHIVLIAYALADELRALLDIKPDNKKNKFHWHLFLHSQIDDVVKVCEEAAERKDVTYYPIGVNRGLSKSWNEGILAGYDAGADVVMVINDDLMPGDGDIEKLAEVAMEQRGKGNLTYMVMGRMFDELESQYTASSFGCFAIQPIALETVGMFDEQFVPIYFEDLDYHYRAHISGLHQYLVEDTDLVHKGSSTIYSSPELKKQNDKTLQANEEYYVKKWGGKPDHERFLKPFDDLRFSTRIAPCDRERPYWGYEREDLYIVEL